MVSRPPRGGNPTIFVSIASYRDPEAQYTVQDLFRKAQRPERVVVGLCLQQAPEDECCFRLDLSEWAAQIRTYIIPHIEAKGPCYARALIEQTLFKDEDYFLQIDSHFRFEESWDEIILEQLHACPSPRPVLTSHVSSYTLPKDYEPGGPDRAVLSTSKALSVLCADSFGDQNKDDVFLRVKSRVTRGSLGDKPLPSPFWTARFSFASSEIVREVPYDHHLEYIFFGEEIAMTVRLWTHGFDLFNPARVVAYHLGSRAHRHWFREVQVGEDAVLKETAAKARLCGLLGIPQQGLMPEPPYGLGMARTLLDYERFAGVSFARQVVEERARTGLLHPSQLPPAWAEEVKDQLMIASQMRDPESWAGKDNAAALARQFPAAAAVTGAAPAKPELGKTRDLLRMQIHALQAQLDACVGDAAADLELELSKAFASLAQVEAADANGRQAAETRSRALRHAEAALELSAGEDGCEAGLRHASALQATGAAQLGLQLFGQAKKSFADALLQLNRNLAAEVPEQLAHDILEGIHSSHEQTDDRAGLCSYMRGIRTLLAHLRKCAGVSAAALPPLELVKVPAPTADEGPPSLRAQLLQRVVLVSIATGRDEDMELARVVFTSFAEARQSATLVRLLGMLQSSGHLLDIE